MSFQRSCIYHRDQPMRVIEQDNEDEYIRLLSSGEWFDHPNKAKEYKEMNHEEQIRQQPRKRRVNGKASSKSL